MTETDSDTQAPVPETSEVPKAKNLRLKGHASHRLMPSLVRMGMAVTGLSLLVGLGRLFARYVLGFRREGQLTVADDKLTFEEERHLLGRQTHKARESFERASVLSAQMEVRYPYLLTLIGLVGLGAGVVVGLVWLLDGIQGEFTPWILSGVGVLLLGVVLDLVLTTIASSMPEKTTLTQRLPHKRIVRLIGCDPAAAEQIVLWLHQKA